MDCGPLCSGFVRFIAHGMNAAGVDPAIVEIEQGADGDCIIDRFVGEPSLVEGLDVGGLNGNGIAIHFSDEAKESFVPIGKKRSLEVRKDACD